MNIKFALIATDVSATNKFIRMLSVIFARQTTSKPAATWRIGTAKILTLIVLSSVGTAYAGSSVGQIEILMALRSNLVIVSAGVHQNKPGCSTIANDWAFSLATVGGRAMYAMLLAAQAQGKVVSVYGEGACTDWGDRETPQYIYISQ